MPKDTLTILYALDVTSEILKDRTKVKVTKYVAKDLIIRAVRKVWKYQKSAKKTGNQEILVTVGRPNYAEREYINKLVKTKPVIFPIRNLQVKYFRKKA